MVIADGHFNLHQEFVWICTWVNVLILSPLSVHNIERPGLVVIVPSILSRIICRVHFHEVTTTEYKMLTLTVPVTAIDALRHFETG